MENCPWDHGPYPVRHCPWELSKKLQANYVVLVNGENENFLKWVLFIELYEF